MDPRIASLTSKLNSEHFSVKSVVQTETRVVENGTRTRGSSVGQRHQVLLRSSRTKEEYGERSAIALPPRGGESASVMSLHSAGANDSLGELRVTVGRGQTMRPFMNDGECNLYLQLFIGAQRHQTSIAWDTQAPNWQEVFSFILETVPIEYDAEEHFASKDDLWMELWHKCMGVPDISLGRQRVALSNLPQGTPQTVDITIGLLDVQLVLQAMDFGLPVLEITRQPTVQSVEEVSIQSSTIETTRSNRFSVIINTLLHEESTQRQRIADAQQVKRAAINAAFLEGRGNASGIAVMRYHAEKGIQRCQNDEQFEREIIVSWQAETWGLLLGQLRQLEGFRSSAHQRIREIVHDFEVRWQHQQEAETLIIERFQQQERQHTAEIEKWRAEAESTRRRYEELRAHAEPEKKRQAARGAAEEKRQQALQQQEQMMLERHQLLQNKLQEEEAVFEHQRQAHVAQQRKWHEELRTAAVRMEDLENETQWKKQQLLEMEARISVARQNLEVLLAEQNRAQEVSALSIASTPVSEKSEQKTQTDSFATCFSSPKRETCAHCCPGPHFPELDTEDWIFDPLLSIASVTNSVSRDRSPLPSPSPSPAPSLPPTQAAHTANGCTVHQFATSAASAIAQLPPAGARPQFTSISRASVPVTPMPMYSYEIPAVARSSPFRMRSPSPIGIPISVTSTPIFTGMPFLRSPSPVPSVTTVAPSYYLPSAVPVTQASFFGSAPNMVEHSTTSAPVWQSVSVWQSDVTTFEKIKTPESRPEASRELYATPIPEPPSANSVKSERRCKAVNVRHGCGFCHCCKQARWIANGAQSSVY
eukprot:TRINITY_DN8256_c0_g1_i1.p1 TRINITY_DN8256_c0_g1~~TRINITY_DN8256_c0_g1_i1.p1  ORF type:complete len:831 (-),score=126.65 TRINITY_DN8256_c0_g1_i1:545-3001(-)